MEHTHTMIRAGRAVAILIASFYILLAAYACSKSENQQSAVEPGKKAVENAGDTVNQVTEQTTAITSEAVKTAGEMVDKATQTAKDAYDAAGDAVDRTTEKAKEAYQSADRMVSDAVSGSGAAPSATEMESPIKVPSKSNDDTVETQVNKALESVPSIPGK